MASIPRRFAAEEIGDLATQRIRQKDDGAELDEIAPMGVRSALDDGYM